MSDSTSSAERIQALARAVLPFVERLKPIEIIIDTPVGPPGILFLFVFVVAQRVTGDIEELENRIGEALTDPDTRVSVWIVDGPEWERLRERPAHAARHVYLHGTSFDPVQLQRQTGAA